MLGRAAGTIPNQNDLPSSWPSAYFQEARDLTRRILADWHQESRRAGRRLAVLYVPRGEAQLRGELAPEDTWKPTLVEACEALSIPMIDPSAALRARMAAGDPVYGDHWTPAGHEEVARVLSDWLHRELGPPPR